MKRYLSLHRAIHLIFAAILIVQQLAPLQVYADTQQTPSDSYSDCIQTPDIVQYGYQPAAWCRSFAGTNDAGAYFKPCTQTGSGSTASNASLASPGSSTATIQPGSGTPTGLTYPNLDASAMAKAIDDYIAEHNPNSALIGQGANIVKSSQKANVNPFAVVAHAQNESSLGDKNDYNVQNANNSFGRTASDSQPGFQGAARWYKWSSAAASVDSSAPENQNAVGGGDFPAYLRNMFGSQIDQNDFGYILKYAPPSSNDTQGYIKKFQAIMADLASRSGGTASPQTSITPSASQANSSTQGDQCCPSSGANATTAAAASPVDCGTSGYKQHTKIPDSPVAGLNENEYVIYRHFIAEGYSPAQAAGITGNLSHEGAGAYPDAVNPQGCSQRADTAIGIVQWCGDRAKKLQKFAETKGSDWNCLSTQLEYIDSELSNSTGWGKAVGAVKATDSPEAAAAAWNANYEIGNDTGARQSRARQIYDAINGAGAASTGATAAPAGQSTDGTSTKDCPNQGSTNV